MTSLTEPLSANGVFDVGTTSLVVYCSSCDYFLKIAVGGDIGTHGCAQCGSLMEVYVAQGTELRDHWHRPPAASLT